MDSQDVRSNAQVHIDARIALCVASSKPYRQVGLENREEEKTRAALSLSLCAMAILTSFDPHAPIPPALHCLALVQQNRGAQDCAKR